MLILLQKPEAETQDEHARHKTLYTPAHAPCGFNKKLLTPPTNKRKPKVACRCCAPFSCHNSAGSSTQKKPVTHKHNKRLMYAVRLPAHALAAPYKAQHNSPNPTQLSSTQHNKHSSHNQHSPAPDTCLITTLLHTVVWQPRNRAVSRQHEIKRADSRLCSLASTSLGCRSTRGSCPALGRCWCWCCCWCLGGRCSCSLCACRRGLHWLLLSWQWGLDVVVVSVGLRSHGWRRCQQPPAAMR